MSRKTRTIWSAALAVGLVAIAMTTSAGAFGRRGGGPGLGRLEHRLEMLNLSADTRTQALAIVDAARTDERALRDQIRGAHQQLGALIQSSPPDENAIDAQVDAIGALQTQAHKQFLHVVLQVAALLPDDQRAQWLAPPHRGGFRGHATR